MLNLNKSITYTLYTSEPYSYMYRPKKKMTDGSVVKHLKITQSEVANVCKPFWPQNLFIIKKMFKKVANKAKFSRKRQNSSSGSGKLKLKFAYCFSIKLTNVDNNFLQIQKMNPNRQ